MFGRWIIPGAISDGFDADQNRNNYWWTPSSNLSTNRILLNRSFFEESGFGLLKLNLLFRDRNMYYRCLMLIRYAYEKFPA